MSEFASALPWGLFSAGFISSLVLFLLYRNRGKTITRLREKLSTEQFRGAARQMVIESYRKGRTELEHKIRVLEVQLAQLDPAALVSTVFGVSDNDPDDRN